MSLRDLWQYRELVYFLTWRDVKVRYKQTALGAAWAVLQPLATMVVFTVIFGRVAHLSSEGVPYPIFALAALLPWMYFAYVLQQSSTCVLENRKIISKVYFPRLVLPFSTAFAGLVDFAITLCLFAALMLIYPGHLGLRAVSLPLFLILAMAASLAVGTWLSALSAKYRDVQYAIPFLTQIWLLASPVGYTAGIVKGKLALVYALNPMVGVIDGFRWALLGTSPGPSAAMLPSVLATLLLLVGGLFYFRRMEQSFADLV